MGSVEVVNVMDGNIRSRQGKEDEGDHLLILGRDATVRSGKTVGREAVGEGGCGLST